MKTIMVTGSTQGLGLEIVKQLAKLPQTRVIMAVRNVAKGREIARQLGSHVSVVELDLSSLAKVRAFTNAWDTKLDGLVNNAGVQLAERESFTKEGFEETIAVNHLASFQLTRGLEPHLAGGKVLFIGSGTHHPTAAKNFGFRGAQFTSIQELAEGKSSAEDLAQRNKDRYATSKFLNTITAVELARRGKSYTSFVLDPGLMVGTGLARGYDGVSRFLWNNVLPLISFILPDSSTPSRSAAVAVWMLTELHGTSADGVILGHLKKPTEWVWREMVDDPKVGAAVYDQTVAFLDRFYASR